MKYFTYLLVLILVSTACNLKHQPTPEKVKYNVVLVIVDDLNDFINPLQQNWPELTPNFNRLAQQSITFTHAYTSAPSCNPSRVAMLTGIQPFNSGVYANPDHFRDSEVLKNRKTLPELFKANGYKTYSTGKVFQVPFGKRADPQSWTDLRKEEGDLMRSSTYVSDSVLANGMHYQTNYERLFDWEEQNVSVEQTSDYKNATWAARIISKEKQPFFLACGIYKPHLPWYLPKGFLKESIEQNLDSINFSATDLNDLSDYALEIIKAEQSNSDFNRMLKANKLKEAKRAYLSSIAFADYCLGTIVDAIESYGDNTILIVVGDHGWHLGEKKHFRKFTLWERAGHVPMFIRLPKGESGKELNDNLLSLIDVYPTLAEYCQLEWDGESDGFDFSSLLKQPKSSSANDFVLTTLEEGSVSLRTKQWRLIRYKDGSVELYDHFMDENEENNLASDPKYQSLIDSLNKKLPTSFYPSVSGFGHLILED